jgi:hypothetical protein
VQRYFTWRRVVLSTEITTHDHTVMYMSDYRRGLDWWLDLLTTYTLTRLVNTLYRSLTHTDQCPQSIKPLAVSWQRPLTMAIPLLPCSSPLWTATPFKLSTLATNSRPFHTNLPVFSSPHQTVPVITTRHGLHRKHSSSVVSGFVAAETFLSCCTTVAFVSVAVGTCLPSRCLETALVYLLISR